MARRVGLGVGSRTVDDLGTLLGIWAHPDDDIYLSSGLMAATALAGGRVVDVTATRGEGGSMDEERWPSASMVRPARSMRTSSARLRLPSNRTRTLPVSSTRCSRSRYSTRSACSSSIVPTPVAVSRMDSEAGVDDGGASARVLDRVL